MSQSTQKQPITLFALPTLFLLSSFLSAQAKTSEPLTIKTAQSWTNHQWTKADMGSYDETSVLFYSSPSSIGNQRGVIRAKQGSKGPEFRFQEWSNLDGQHVSERIGLVKMNKGRWRYGDHELEVGTTKISGTETWVKVNFSQAFKTAPKVILSIQTTNGSQGVSTRVQNITKTSMEIQLVEEDLKKFSGHLPETIGYLLVSSSASSFEVEGGAKIEILPKDKLLQLNHNWTTVESGYQLRLEEDQTTDTEVAHLNELIHVLKINGIYLSQIVSDHGDDNAVLRSSTEFFEPKIRKRAQIDQLIVDKGCDSTQQCKEIAFGSKPCGGPWSFLVYSTRQTNEPILSNAVDQYNKLEQQQNTQNELSSDCSVAQQNYPVCSENICVADDQQPIAPTAAQLTRFSSDQSLEKFIKSGLLGIEKSRFNPYLPPMSAVGPPPSVQEDSSRSAIFSTTNIQEQGVDEADFLKTDGQYLYVSGPNQKQIRILEMHSQPHRVTKQAMIDIDSDNTNLRGLYLLSNRGNQDPDLLVSVHANYQAVGSADIGYNPWHWMNKRTKINLYNVSTPAKPQKQTTIMLDGSLLASRLIDESLYVVTRYVPIIPPPDSNFWQTPAQQANDRVATIEQASLTQLLPNITLNNGALSEQKLPLISAQQTFLPPMPDDYRSPDLLTISRFDLNNPSVPPKTTTVIGNSDSIYVSTHAVYLATSHYGYQEFIDVIGFPRLSGLPRENSTLRESSPFILKESTQIHKISLTDTRPEYKGSTTIEGLITGQEDQRRYRFSEHNNILRVVTRGEWGAMGEHRITLLDETATGDLETIAYLPNKTRPHRLGKPGEQLYATRFMGNRLFLVTFKQIDPLIAIDLSTPSDPKLQGELEIPGFSDYLHPLNENLLLGIGKHVVSADGSGDGRFAWFQGIRIGLFDISGTDGPKELDTIVIGERGSQSEALSDTHAFSFLPANPQTQQPFKFTMPIAVHGKTFPGLTPIEARAYPKWSHTGLYLFEVDTTAAKPALKNTGVIKVSDSLQGDINWRNMSAGTNRAVLLNEGVFFSHQTHIWSADWATPAQAIGPQ